MFWHRDRFIRGDLYRKLISGHAPEPRYNSLKIMRADLSPFLDDKEWEVYEFTSELTRVLNKYYIQEDGGFRFHDTDKCLLSEFSVDCPIRGRNIDVWYNELRVGRLEITNTLWFGDEAKPQSATIEFGILSPEKILIGPIPAVDFFLRIGGLYARFIAFDEIRGMANWLVKLLVDRTKQVMFEPPDIDLSMLRCIWQLENRADLSERIF